MIAVFGAGGFTRQIMDFLPADTVLLTDEGGGQLHDFPILPFDPQPDALLVIAVSDATIRRKVALRWHNGFGTLIAPSAEISRFARIGGGAIICRQAIIEADAVTGSHFHANLGAKIGHECRIGDFVTVGPGAMICGGCTVERGATIGAGAIVKQGLTIGANAVIGMGAVVHKNVPAGATALGNPARVFHHAVRLQVA